MYTESAEFYDQIYAFKEYAQESAFIRDIIKNKLPNGQRILDVGCGTSEHHRFLNQHYQIDGIDLNESFIEISKRKNPAGNYWVENMTCFDLPHTYDVILCLFSSIGYLNNLSEIELAFSNFYHHLKPNGLVVLEPWFTPDSWKIGKLGMVSIDNPDQKICRINRSYLSGNYTILEFHYMIGHLKEGIRSFKEEHKLRLSTQSEITNAFYRTGFEVHYEAQGLTGRGMYYATKINK